MPEHPEASRYRVDALAKGLAVLSLFGAGTPGLSARDMARRLHLPLTTLRRLLATLESEGYVERLPGSNDYGLALGALSLGFGSLFSLSLGELATVEMHRLHADTAGSVFLDVCAGTEAVTLSAILRPGFLQPHGHRFPIHSTSTGKAFLAFCAAGQRERILGEIRWDKVGPNTITSRVEFERDLAASRQRGYALNVEEMLPGVISVGAPILGRNGNAIASIALQQGLGRLPAADLERRVAPRVLEAAARISERLILMDIDFEGRARLRG